MMARRRGAPPPPRTGPRQDSRVQAGAKAPQRPGKQSALSDTMRSEHAFTFSQAVSEAWRCLQCFDPPCTQACPAGIVIPRFIRMIRSWNIEGAAEVVRSSNPMAMSCGLACPDEQLCASACTRAEIDRPVEIRRLHQFVTEQSDVTRPRPPKVAPCVEGRRIAIVGAGPAGLACAFELRRVGLSVTLFEKRDRLGGVLSNTIPLYRFSEGAVLQDARWSLGLPLRRSHSRAKKARTDKSQASADVTLRASVDVRLRTEATDVETLAKEFDAVFIATGISGSTSAAAAVKPGTASGAPEVSPTSPAIPPTELETASARHGAVSLPLPLEGIHLKGVCAAEDFLERCRRVRYRNTIGSDVVVIGGGNVAVDAALAAVQCGEMRSAAGPLRATARRGQITAKPRVHILYRRTRAQMPAWERELQEAECAGVVIHFLVSPVALVGKRGRLTGIKLGKTTLGPEDASGRPRPVPLPGSEFIMPCDQAILATGMRLDRGPLGTLPITKHGLLRANPRTRRVRGNIFAGGDAAGAEQSIVAAVRDGKLAARAIAASLGVKDV